MPDGFRAFVDEMLRRERPPRAFRRGNGPVREGRSYHAEVDGQYVGARSLNELVVKLRILGVNASATGHDRLSPLGSTRRHFETPGFTNA